MIHPRLRALLTEGVRRGVGGLIVSGTVVGLPGQGTWRGTFGTPAVPLLASVQGAMGPRWGVRMATFLATEFPPLMAGTRYETRCTAATGAGVGFITGGTPGHMATALRVWMAEHGWGGSHMDFEGLERGIYVALIGSVVPGVVTGTTAGTVPLTVPFLGKGLP